MTARIFFQFTLILLFKSTTGLGQEKDYLKNIREAGQFNLSLLSKTFYKEDLRLPISGISILDYRFDSSKIGYVDKGCPEAAYCRVVAATGWNETLQNYFQKNIQPGSPHSLLIVIRKFWMQEGLVDELTDKKVVQSEWMSKKNRGGVCKAGLDIFIRTGDQYQPLFKLDASFLHTYNYRAGRLDEWFFLPFDSVARRINGINLTETLTGKRKITLPEIQSFYSERQQLPVFKEPIRKGVFLRYEDFQNNKPMETVFRISRGKLTDELYTGEKKNETILAEFWGAYDGKDLYIRSGFNIFQAIRQQNSFEIFGAKHISNVHNDPAPGQLVRVNEMNVFLKILQMDMETGEFY